MYDTGISNSPRELAQHLHPVSFLPQQPEYSPEAQVFKITISTSNGGSLC